MVGRNKLDHVWLDVGKEGKLFTICNCCPCCCISNMASEASSGIREKYRKMPGVKVEVTENCVGCGTCTEICYMNAIKIEENQAKIGKECIGCGQCARNCPNDAIKLTIEDPEFLEKSIKSLENKVDVS